MKAIAAAHIYAIVFLTVLNRFTNRFTNSLMATSSLTG